MATINISLNEDLVKVVNQEMKKRKYTSRSEFFRDLIRNTFFPVNDGLNQEETIELDARIKRLEKNQEKIFNLKDFNKKFNF